MFSLAQTMPPIEPPIDLVSVGVAIAGVGGVMLLIWAGLYIAFTASKTLIRRLSVVTDGSAGRGSSSGGAALDWTGSGNGQRRLARRKNWGSTWEDSQVRPDRASSTPRQTRRR